MTIDERQRELKKYKGSPLTNQHHEFLEKLVQSGLSYKVTSKSNKANTGKTIQILRDGQKLAYINDTVVKKGGALIGLHFPDQPRPSDACPPELSNNLLEWACEQFACAPDDLFVDKRSGNSYNSGRTFLLIKSAPAAFRALGVEEGGVENVSRADGDPQIEDDPPVSQSGAGAIAKLSVKQIRILKVLALRVGWLTRRKMEEYAGEKGYSKALGAPTRGEPRPGTLEQLRYVKRRDLSQPFEYRITKAGKRALTEFEREHGEVQLLSGLSPSAESVFEDIQEISRRKLETTEKESLIKARLGQGRFREDVLRNWGNACAVSGSSVLDAIRASHIKPWRNANDDERLDPFNGLPLTANLDALFDAGLIAFDEGGYLLISSSLNKTECSIFALVGKSLRKAPPKKSLTYLKYHRKNIFRE